MLAHVEDRELLEQQLLDCNEALHPRQQQPELRVVRSPHGRNRQGAFTGLACAFGLGATAVPTDADEEYARHGSASCLQTRKQTLRLVRALKHGVRG